MIAPRRHGDYTQVRNQPALTSSHGLVWLVVGTICSVILIALFLWLSRVVAGVSFVVVSLILLSCIAMWTIRFKVTDQRLRLIALASVLVFMVGLALIGAITINVVALSQGG